ncbi:MAG: hypothetical protein ACR2J8_07765, partial [Thermomicrobiales bacterium]
TCPATNFTGLLDCYSLSFIMMVPTIDGSSEGIMVGFNGDPSGLLEGTYVRVFGIVSGNTATGVNAFGAESELPIIEAELIQF